MSSKCPRVSSLFEGRKWDTPSHLYINHKPCPFAVPCCTHCPHPYGGTLHSTPCCPLTVLRCAHCPHPYGGTLNAKYLRQRCNGQCLLSLFALLAWLCLLSLFALLAWLCLVVPFRPFRPFSPHIVRSTGKRSNSNNRGLSAAKPSDRMPPLQNRPQGRVATANK